MAEPSPELLGIATRAADMVQDGSVLGLGTGRAATAFLHILAQRIQAGLRVRGVPTSEASADLALELGIPLSGLEDTEVLDLDVDGADEVDPQGNLIKGYGGALLREKIVAMASRRLVILVGAEKLVPVLGSRGIVPIEVLPFALPWCRRRLAAEGITSTPRKEGNARFVTDNGNYILDCAVSPLSQPAQLDQELRAIPGVLGSGLFLNMAPTVLIQEGDQVVVREHSKTTPAPAGAAPH
jgi:ribose 5-phosphate isomerase A